MFKKAQLVLFLDCVVYVKSASKNIQTKNKTFIYCIRNTEMKIKSSVIPYSSSSGTKETNSFIKFKYRTGGVDRSKGVCEMHIWKINVSG